MNHDQIPEQEWIRADDPFLGTFRTFRQTISLQGRRVSGKDKLVLGGLMFLFGLFLLFLGIVTAAAGVVSVIANLFRPRRPVG
jgi:hypothetical protein